MNAQDERNRAVRNQAGAWCKEKLIDEETQRAVEASLVVPWRSYSVIAQCVFFVLTAIGMVAAYGLSYVVGLPLRGVFVGVAFVAAGEFLIRRKWLDTGVEVALWIGGLVAMISELPSSGKPEALLVFAAICAITGVRVRNPIFGTAAAIFVMIYAEEKMDLGVIAALVMGGIAVLALLREWRRPSTEWLWILLALVMPLAGRFMADDEWWRMTITLYAIFGVLALVLAIVRRHHALFFSGTIALAVAAVELLEEVSLGTPEEKLAVGGVFLFALAAVVSRALRARTTGIVVTRSSLTGSDEMLAVGGALLANRALDAQAPPQAAPHASPSSGGAPVSAPGQGDGGFGGAGATGNY